MGRVADIPQPEESAAEHAESANAQIWRFSLAFYARPSVEAALIALQDREGLDVNLILFGLWLGVSGRGRLDRRGLAAADRAIRAIRVEIVEPLRALRRRLKSAPDADIQRLREAVEAIELKAEKTALHRLAGSAAPPDGDADPAARLAAAQANFALCLGPETALAVEAAVIREAVARFVADR
jgi:uncharacterized protein (TIGR02444 family)